MPVIKTTRRGFMQLSATSAAALAVAGSFASLTGCSKTPPATGFKVLRPGDVEIFKALAPVILKGSYPGPLGDKAEITLLQELDRLIVTLQDYSRSQLVLLFDVLQAGPVRFVAGGPWKSWSEVSEAEAEAFLQDWKTSMFQIKRMGYGSLIKLYAMCWYKIPANFVQTGYPGMPKRELLS